MAARHGGKRRNAGRRPKSVKHESVIAAAEGRISDRLPTLIDNLFALADGVEVQIERDNGSTYVYTTPPDLRANIYLIDRVMGKPTERHEHDFSHLTDEELIARATSDLLGDGAARAEAADDE
jgi:hypothetical protein